MGLVLLTGCTATAPTPTDVTDPAAPAAGSGPATGGELGPATGAETIPPDTAEADTAAAVFGRLADYWRQAFPLAFGDPWVELRGGARPLDSAVAGGRVLCIADPAQITGNAFYCPADDGIVYDTGVLVPVVLAHYGLDGLTASLAHEFGHAVAVRTGAPDRPVLRELQADCFAGAALASMVETDRQVAALAPLLDFADQPTMDPNQAAAHGMAVDRAQAALLGLRSGPAGCTDLGPADIDIALGRFPPTTDAAPRPLSDVSVSAADRELAVPLGDAALAAAARLEQSTEPPGTDQGCALGRWMGEVFGAVGPDQVGGRLTDPDEVLGLLRARPGTDRDTVLGYLDGLAGRCVPSAPVQ